MLSTHHLLPGTLGEPDDSLHFTGEEPVTYSGCRTCPAAKGDLTQMGTFCLCVGFQLRRALCGGLTTWGRGEGISEGSRASCEFSCIPGRIPPAPTLQAGDCSGTHTHTQRLSHTHLLMHMFANAHTHKLTFALMLRHSHVHVCCHTHA